MAENSLSPAFIRIEYFRDAVRHVMTIPTKFSGSVTPGTAPALLLHSTSSVPFINAMGAWNDLLEPCFGPTTTFNSAEVWSQPAPTDDPVWIYTYGMAGTGTNGVANQAASQLAFSFRTDQGGLFRLYLMEQPLAPNQRVSYASMTNPHLALANFVTGETSWIYGRDGGEVIHTLAYKTKTNDVLRRRLLTG